MKPQIRFWAIVLAIFAGWEYVFYSVAGYFRVDGLLMSAAFTLISLLIIAGIIIAVDNQKQKSKAKETQSDEEEEQDDVLAATTDITKEYFNICHGLAEMMYDYLEEANNNKDFVDFINSIKGLEQVDEIDNTGEFNSRLFVFFLYDFVKIYTELGHKLEPDKKEILTLGLFMCMTLKATDLCEYENLSQLYSNIMPTVTSFMTIMRDITDPEMGDKYAFYFPRMYDVYDSEQIQSYKVLLYRFASIIAKADGEVTPKETEYLSGLMLGIEDILSDTKDTERLPQKEIVVRSINPAQELDSLIGLDDVKNEVKKLSNFIKIQQARESEGLKSTPISYHCVFTGNPGTGKTTVARIIAEIYRDLGILAKGHLVETDRSGLVAEYIGQTAVKTNKIIDSALDGVLFIDEAYSLVSGGGNDYGLEAIATLLKRMEDDRTRLVVILAGYGNEMKSFIDANPGLQSRFNRYIHFQDYSADELLEIFRLNVSKHDYILSGDVEECLKQVIEKAVESKDKNFGNARFVRNLFEKTLENQATRLASVGTLTKDLLQEIRTEDIPQL